MSKQIIQRYTFAPAARTVTFTDFDTPVRLERLALITHLPTNTIIFNFADPTRGATVAGNVVTLAYDTTALATGPLRIDYDTLFDDQAYDKTTVGNARTKFRDGFATPQAQPNPLVWDSVVDDAGHIITQGGDSFGASYLRVSLSPFVDNSGVTLTSKKVFKFPMKLGVGLSTSQRILGQEVFLGMVATDGTPAGNIDYMAAQPDLPLTGTTASITSNVANFTMTNHGLKGGDRIEIEFCTDKRLNVGPVAVTVLDTNTFQVPCTLANGTYTSTGGVVRFVDPLRLARNGAGLLLENTTATNASFVSRRNGSKFRSANNTVGSMNSTQSSTSPYTDALNAASAQELYFSMDEIAFRSYAADSNNGTSGYNKYTQGIPDEDPEYKIHLRARNLTGLTMPVAKISSIAKTGTTTATVTTSTPHGLAITDWVQIYGVWDQTNYPNLTSQTQVSSVIDANNFTIIIGGAVTATSLGGAVWQVQGSVLAPGAFNAAIQSIQRTSGVMYVTMNSTGHGVGSANYGEFHHFWGMTGAPAYEGAYKLMRVNGAVLEYDSQAADFAQITGVGGALIRRTDVRWHFARVMDYTRLAVEVLGGKGGTSDQNNAVPVTVTASSTVPTSQSTGSAGTIWNAAGYADLLTNDTVSGAITTSATTSAVIPGTIGNLGVYSHSFNTAVTIVTGTSPTYDLSVEESTDNGTNWVRVYDFPRITTTGSYTSPLMRSQFGTRFRYVQTLGGTSPSFTRAINRVQFSSNGPLYRQFFDRSIVLTTLNSTTPVYNIDGATKLQLTVNIGAVTTTAPVLQMEGSEDGANWYAIGAAMTAVASSTVMAASTDTAYPRFVRVRASTAGVGVTAGYISIKAIGA